jgi:hypothetical protein
MSRNVESQQINVAAQALSMGLFLVCKKGLFGGLKPNDKQIGFCFGFCDAITQNLGYDQTESLAFIAIVFEKIFGRKGSKYVGEVIANQMAFKDTVVDGGNAFHKWGKDGTPPIPQYWTD